MPPTITLELTRSQHKALIDLITEFVRYSDTTEWIDEVPSPAVTTTPGELLRLISEAE